MLILDPSRLDQYLLRLANAIARMHLGRPWSEAATPLRVSYFEPYTASLSEERQADCKTINELLDTLDDPELNRALGPAKPFDRSLKKRPPTYPVQTASCFQ